VNTWDARSLHYYLHNFSGCPTRVGDLLQTGDGNCNAWAELLRDSLRVNGVDSQRTTVTSGDGFGVKNLAFNGAPATPACGAYKYTQSQIDTSVAGLPGQNMATPSEKLFGVH